MIVYIVFSITDEGSDTFIEVFDSEQKCEDYIKKMDEINPDFQFYFTEHEVK